MMLNGFRFSALRYAATAQRHFSTGQKSLIINAVGNDRLGIVSDMSKFVNDAGGNVGESQAALLGSHFSLMMIVTVPESEVEGLVNRLNNMKDMNASVFVSNEDADVTSIRPKIGYSGRFKVEGADHPGIVHSVTSLLSRNGLSIDKMETTDEIAPQGGTVLFKMVGIANAYEPVASGFDIDKINEQLNALGDDLNCDIHIEDA